MGRKSFIPVSVFTHYAHKLILNKNSHVVNTYFSTYLYVYFKNLQKYNQKIYSYLHCLVLKN